MGRRAEPQALVWQDGPALFEFVLNAEFTGPVTTDSGLAYHRPGLDIEIRVVTRREAELVTTVRHTPADGSGARSASLDCLYLACRCGVLQDVPGSALTCGPRPDDYASTPTPSAASCLFCWPVMSPG